MLIPGLGKTNINLQKISYKQWVMRYFIEYWHYLKGLNKETEIFLLFISNRNLVPKI